MSQQEPIQDNSESSANDTIFLVPVSIEALKSVFGEVVEQKNLQQAEMSQAEANVKCFDFCVDFLRHFDDSETSRIFNGLWYLIANKLNVVVAQYPTLQEVSIVVLQNPCQAVILIPDNFAQLFEQDMLHQIGAVFFVGFQAWYIAHNVNELIAGNFNSKALSRSAYIAEGRFLKLFFERSPLTPNEYQQQLISVFEATLGDGEAV